MKEEEEEEEEAKAGGAEKTGEDSAVTSAAVEIGDTVVIIIGEAPTAPCPRTLLGEGHEVLRWCARSNVIVVVVVVSLSWPSLMFLMVVVDFCAGRSGRDSTLVTPPTPTPAPAMPWPVVARDRFAKGTSLLMSFARTGRMACVILFSSVIKASLSSSVVDLVKSSYPLICAMTSSVNVANRIKRRSLSCNDSGWMDEWVERCELANEGLVVLRKIGLTKEGYVPMVLWSNPSLVFNHIHSCKSVSNSGK